MHRNATKALRVVDHHPHHLPMLRVDITASNGERTVRYSAELAGDVPADELAAVDRLIERARKGRRIVDVRP